MHAEEIKNGRRVQIRNDATYDLTFEKTLEELGIKVQADQKNQDRRTG